MEGKEKYKCGKCDSTSDGEAGTCCEGNRDKLCNCDSGKVAKECCEA